MLCCSISQKSQWSPYHTWFHAKGIWAAEEALIVTPIIHPQNSRMIELKQTICTEITTGSLGLSYISLDYLTQACKYTEIKSIFLQCRDYQHLLIYSYLLLLADPSENLLQNDHLGKGIIFLQLHQRKSGNEDSHSRSLLLNTLAQDMAT